MTAAWAFTIKSRAYGRCPDHYNEVSCHRDCTRLYRGE